MKQNTFQQFSNTPFKPSKKLHLQVQTNQSPSKQSSIRTKPKLQPQISQFTEGNTEKTYKVPKSMNLQRMIIKMVDIILENPELRLEWDFFLEQRNLRKLGIYISKHRMACQQKISELKRIQQSFYPEKNIGQFLCCFWDSQRFCDQNGKDLVKELKQVIQGRKNHMKLCQEMLIKQCQTGQSVIDLYMSIML